jgi:hypothetical protein
VTPGYHTALGIRLVRGRTFSVDESRAADAVVVVSESAARQLWPTGDAIGATVRMSSPHTGAQTPVRSARVIGVVGDVVGGFIGERRDHPTIYEPGAVEQPGGTLLVAMRSSSIVARESVLRWVDESVELQLYPFRAAHWVASAVGLIALLLTVTGIYGVLAYVVAMREKEIGIRVALGATRGMIVGLVVRQSVRLATIGVVAGVALALGASRVVASRLTMIPTFDAVALGVGSGVVLLAALAAAYVPSRRAAAVDPVESLKT